MLKRVITGSGIVAVTVGFFMLRRYVDCRLFYAFIIMLGVFGTYEMLRAHGEKLVLAQTITVFVASICGLCLAAFVSFQMAMVAYAVAALILLSCSVFDHANVNTEKLATSVLCLVYPSVLLIPLVLTNGLDGGGGISLFALVFIFIVSPLSDTLAYLTGITFKGKKLCPAVSPKKTISGAIGGLIGAMGGALIAYAVYKNTFNYHLSTNPYLYFSVVGLVAGVLTELGDLVESMLKRNLGIKDMGRILPGHGGILDRIDGLIFASVFIYFVVALI